MKAAERYARARATVVDSEVVRLSMASLWKYLHEDEARQGKAWRQHMTTEQGLELVHLCLHLAAVMQPRVWCLENPGSSLAWTVTPRIQRVLLGWWGFPALKPTGLGGDFEPVALPFPLPEIDPTAGGRRPSGAVKGKGGVQAMPSYLRSRTPPDFARAWWTAQAPRLAGAA